MEQSCGKCKQRIKNDEEKWWCCDCCQDFLHEKCSGLTASEKKVLELQKRIMFFFCSACRDSLKQIPLLVRKISDLQDQNTILKKELIEIKNQKAISDIDSVHYEVQERIVRARNIMAYNIKESSSGDLEVRIAEDKSIVSDILMKAGINSDSILKVIRVGKRSQDKSKTRPLKVVLPDRDKVLLALKHKKNMPPGINIGADLTLAQRDHIKQLKQELQSLKDSGEGNYSIKYIKGVPRIVKSSDTNNKKN